eukprot:GHVS01058096.1.p1 GENE.GHVS01058096.1~~GHVS01058096.1.p1  ORF type:complete len:1163 (+),score=186.86 GHVS01058096.1:542-4030(+)
MEEPPVVSMSPSSSSCFTSSTSSRCCSSSSCCSRSSSCPVLPSCTSSKLIYSRSGPKERFRWLHVQRDLSKLPDRFHKLFDLAAPPKFLRIFMQLQTPLPQSDIERSFEMAHRCGVVPEPARVSVVALDSSPDGSVDNGGGLKIQEAGGSRKAIWCLRYCIDIHTKEKDDVNYYLNGLRFVGGNAVAPVGFTSLRSPTSQSSSFSSLAPGGGAYPATGLRRLLCEQLRTKFDPPDGPTAPQRASCDVTTSAGSSGSEADNSSNNSSSQLSQPINSRHRIPSTVEEVGPPFLRATPRGQRLPAAFFKILAGQRLRECPLPSSQFCLKINLPGRLVGPKESSQEDVMAALEKRFMDLWGPGGSHLSQLQWHPAVAGLGQWSRPGVLSERAAREEVRQAADVERGGAAEEDGADEGEVEGFITAVECWFFSPNSPLVMVKIATSNVLTALRLALLLQPRHHHSSPTNANPVASPLLPCGSSPTVFPHFSRLPPASGHLLPQSQAPPLPVVSRQHHHRLWYRILRDIFPADPKCVSFNWTSLHSWIYIPRQPTLGSWYFLLQAHRRDSAVLLNTREASGGSKRLLPSDCSTGRGEEANNSPLLQGSCPRGEEGCGRCATCRASGEWSSGWDMDRKKRRKKTKGFGGVVRRLVSSAQPGGERNVGEDAEKPRDDYQIAGAEVRADGAPAAAARQIAEHQPDGSRTPVPSQSSSPYSASGGSSLFNLLHTVLSPVDDASAAPTPPSIPHTSRSDLETIHTATQNGAAVGSSTQQNEAVDISFVMFESLLQACHAKTVAKLQQAFPHRGTSDNSAHIDVYSENHLQGASLGQESAECLGDPSTRDDGDELFRPLVVPQGPLSTVAAYHSTVLAAAINVVYDYARVSWSTRGNHQGVHVPFTPLLIVEGSAAKTMTTVSDAGDGTKICEPVASANSTSRRLATRQRLRSLFDSIPSSYGPTSRPSHGSVSASDPCSVIISPVGQAPVAPSKMARSPYGPSAPQTASAMETSSASLKVPAHGGEDRDEPKLVTLVEPIPFPSSPCTFFSSPPFYSPFLAPLSSSSGGGAELPPKFPKPLFSPNVAARRDPAVPAARNPLLAPSQLATCLKRPSQQCADTPRMGWGSGFSKQLWGTWGRGGSLSKRHGSSGRGGLRRRDGRGLVNPLVRGGE